MVVRRQGFLILDANVLIDYCAADRTILTLISRHVDKSLFRSNCLKRSSRSMRANASASAYACSSLSWNCSWPWEAPTGLSYYDHLCLLVAKQGGWTCVTNDGNSAATASPKTCQSSGAGANDRSCRLR